MSDKLQTRETMLLHLENENKAADLNFPRIGINTAELRSEVERLLEEAAQSIVTSRNCSGVRPKLHVSVLLLASRPALREKLVKIGAKVVSHGRYVTFQMAEVAIPRQMFAEIISLIARLRAPPAPA